MRLATELEGERAELVRAVIAPSAGSVMPLSRPASPGGALEIEPAALLPVSIDRRTVSPTTRPAPASRMHGWPAVADLTLDRPIRIALVQVGAAPKAPAHFKRNCPGTLGDVNPLRNKGLRFPPRRKLASKRVQNTTLGAIAQKNTSIYQWVGVPGQLPLNFLS